MLSAYIFALSCLTLVECWYLSHVGLVLRLVYSVPVMGSTCGKSTIRILTLEISLEISRSTNTKGHKDIVKLDSHYGQGSP